MQTRIQVWIGALLSLVLLGGIAQAQVATTYSSNKRTLKAGILLLDSTIDANLDGAISPQEAALGPENPDPFIFYIADKDPWGTKPQNWEFVNPLSSKTVTSDVAARWLARTGGNGEQYQVGQQLTKNMAAYWEVPLTDTPVQDLLQFDLLFITNHRITRLTAPDREKLRKLVDAGGVLWIEDCGNMRMDGAGPLFLDQLQFSGGQGEATTGPAFPVVNVPNHPILNSPHPLSPLEVANLGDKNYANYALVSLFNPNAPPNPETLVNVVGNAARGGLPYIAAGTYGAGRVIATAGDSACDINDYAGGIRTPSGGNSGAFCGENLITAHNEDLKFLYNIVAWGSANSQYRKDPRRTGASFESLGSSLITAFNVGNPPLGGVESRLNSTTAPLVSKGVVYVTGKDFSSGTPAVHAYNAHPSLVTGDKGIPDLSLGATYDELWRWEGTGGMPSSPVLGTVFDASASDTRLQYGDYIFVTLGNGGLVRLTALLADGSGNISPTPTAQANAPLGSGSYTDANGGEIPAPSPLVHDGKVYVVEPNGLLRCVNAATLETLWYSFAMDQDPVYHPTGSPTLGYARLAITSGAGQSSVAANASGNSNDLMLYVPVWMENPSGGKILRTMTYWLGARHEVILRDQVPGNFPTRAYQGALTANRQYVALNPGYPAPPVAGYPFVRPVVRVFKNRYDGGGNLVATALDEMNAGNVSSVYTGRFVDDNGMVRVEDSGGNPPTRGVVGPGSTPDNVLVSVDYDVYYVTANETPPGLSQPNTNAARPNPNLTLNGYLGGGEGITMTPTDLLVSAAQYIDPRVSNPDQKLTVLSGDYEQYGLTYLRQSLTIFELPAGGPSVAILSVAGQMVAERPTLSNRISFGTFLSEDLGHTASLMGSYESLRGVEPVGVPVVTNEGVAYQVLRAVSSSGGAGGVSIPVTVVVALDMNKQVILNLPESYNPAYQVKLAQLDISTYDPTSSEQPPVVAATLPQSGTNPVSISPNLAGDASRGRIVVNDMRVNGRRFSSSLSFVVTYVPTGGTSEKSVVITPTPLLPNNGAQSDIETRGLVNGGYSPLLWYYVLPGTPTSSVTLMGDMLYLGIQDPSGEAKIVALDSDPASNDPSVRPGLGLQVEAVANNINSKINHVRWVRRTAGRVTGAPVGSQGTLAVSTVSGTQAFETGVTLVTDAKRILEVDGSGAALWTLDGTMRSQVAGGAVETFDPSVIPDPATLTGRIVTERKPLSHPSLARRLSASDYLICDTGNNRVVRVDRGGLVRWELDDVNDVFGVLASTDTKTLNGPTDVQVFTVLTPGGLGYEVHYLIADAGNSRIIEVADYYNRDGIIRDIATPNGPQRGEQVVIWVSRTLSKEGRPLRFQSIQRVLTYGDARLGQDPTLYGYPTILAAVGNSSAAGESGGDTKSDFTGGSLLTLVYNPVDTAFPLLNNLGASTGLYRPWPVTAGNPSAEPAQNGLPDRTMNELVMPVGYQGDPQRRVRRIVLPTYIEQFRVPDTANPGRSKPVFLICDSSGAYQVELGADNKWYVTWYFDTNDYKAMMAQRLGLAPGVDPGLGFMPNAIKRLPSGDYLVTNAWVGSSPLFTSGQFVGEVFQVSSDRRFDPVTGNQLDAVVRPVYNGFSAPNLVLTRDSFGVVIRREQKMGSTTSNTNLLEHPLFGDRL